MNNYLKNNRTSEMNSDLKEAIELIKESVGDEKEDEEFYKLLLTLATNIEDINIINSIIADERKHNQILRNRQEQMFLLPKFCQESN